MVEKRRFGWKMTALTCILFFIAEYALFRTYAYREVIGSMPRNTDQNAYMTVAFSIYENIVSRNWQEVFSIIKTRLNTGGLILPAVLNMFLFGNSHFSFLLLNFFAFAMAQIVGSYSIYKISGSKKYAVLFACLILGLQSTFYWSGDLLDFRQDFVAFALYTCWFALWLLSIHSENSSLYYASAVAAGMLIFCRMLTVSYIGISILVFEIFLILVFRQSTFVKELWRLAKYAAVTVLCGGWFLLLRISSFLSYYISLHLLNNEPEIRAKEQEVYNLYDNLLFYPRSLAKDHLGVVLSVVLLLLLCAVAVGRFLSNKRWETRQKQCVAAGIVGILVPMAVLTIDVSKSSVVINIIAGAAVYLTVYMFAVQFSEKRLWLTAAVAVLCLIGAGNYIKNTASAHPGYSGAEQKPLIEINDTIADYIKETGKEEPKILVDHLLDAVRYTSVEFWLYTQHGEYVIVRDAVKSGNPPPDAIIRSSEVSREISPEEIREALNSADIIVMAEDGYGESIYTTDQQFDKYRELMWSYASGHMTQLKSVILDGRRMYIFVR